jgi:CBS domain-containing protein
MKVQECMSRDVKIAAPAQSIQDAASMMGDIDCGFLPVGEDDRLVGTITDRDIAVRAIGQGKGPETPVRDVMSKEVLYCYEDQDLAHVTKNMAEQQVRRLPVLNRDKRLVGIVSLGDVALSDGNAKRTGDALNAISQPSGNHSQSE